MCNTKLIQLLSLLVGLLLVIAACSENKSTNGGEDPDPTENADSSFVAMAVGRTITFVSGMTVKMDMITARFDSSYAPCNAIKPAQVAAISCNEYNLTWQPELNQYQYLDVIDNPDFITLGGKYIFNITGMGDIPSFIDTIDFPVYETYVTTPSYMGVVSSSGFEIMWESGDGTGTVMLFLMDAQNDTTLYVETDNNGSYTFDAAALSGLTAGQYGLLMIHENWDYITVDGIDSRSFIRARVINTTPIIIN